VKLRGIVADDDPGFLSEMIRTLSVEFDIIAMASDARSALDSIRTLKPEIAVVDLTMPALNGIESTEKATCSPPKLAVVLCSVEAIQRLSSTPGAPAGSHASLSLGSQPIWLRP
jgi:DNA-binding NarL/FixJ family response regulator